MSTIALIISAAFGAGLVLAGFAFLLFSGGRKDLRVESVGPTPDEARVRLVTAETAAIAKAEGRAEEVENAPISEKIALARDYAERNKLRHK